MNQTLALAACFLMANANLQGGECVYTLRLFSYSDHAMAIFSDGTEDVCISWYPRSEGVGPRPGMLLSEKESRERAARMGYRVRCDGDFRIDADLFRAAKRRHAELASGKLAYSGFDWGLRHLGAVNCRTAIAGVMKPLPVMIAVTGWEANERIVRHWGLE